MNPPDKPLRIMRYEISREELNRLDDRERKLLIWTMHAHNEIATLNRLFLFCFNESRDGELEDAAHTGQIWCLGQLLSSKLFEAWLMLRDNIPLSKLSEELLAALTPSNVESLNWLSKYFGVTNLKQSSIKLVRDNTAFHYGDVDTGRAQKDLQPMEMTVFLAQHPVNSVYNIGSSTIFRAVFGFVADKIGVPKTETDHARIGMRSWIKDVREVNDHMHQLLYAIIRHLLIRAKGGALGPPTEEIRPEAGNYDEVILPLFLNMGYGKHHT